MRLYLVRHGRALPKDENPEQPLSPGGREDVERMASFLARSGIRPARVFHSGKTRAAETALVLSTTLGAGHLVEEMTGLSPMDDPRPLIQAARTWADDVMVVGHNPFMERTVSRLLTRGGEGPPVAAFPTAAVCCLERLDDATWVMRWHASPALLGG